LFLSAITNRPLRSRHDPRRSFPPPGTLPRTGLDAGLIALIGGGLLVAGIGLRRRTADAERR